jgi:DNA ligase D-like protein (predicted 3'-phosphoesterase)
MDKRGWRWPDGRRILDGPGHGPAELDRARLQAGKLAAAQVADGAVTTLTWTADGQLADRVFPDGSRERRAYDAEGNLVAYLSPSGEPTRYEYGPFDRLTVVTGPDGTRTEFRYDHALRLTAVTRAGLTWRYDYDAAGRLVAETDFNGAVTRYAYDPAGQLTSRTNAAGQAVTYAYDELGRLVRRAAGEVVSSFGYDAAGRLIRASSPDAESGSPATRSAASPPKLPRLRTTARTGLIRQAAPGAGAESVAHTGGVAGRTRFVVQLHDATTLHFDFRLQSGDVLRSWAVPKGPSLDPSVRRLAVPVDDHSLAAGEFEGVHDGQRRGTGAVIIWDEGTADLLRDEPGHVSFILHGRKLSGGFALTRTGPKRWILVKVRDEDARPGSDIIAEQPASVRSGKTWRQLRDG